MIDVKYTVSFIEWLDGIKDITVKVRLKKRLDKASRGLLGDVKPVGEGIYEMREYFGSGYRMYYVKRGKALIVMLGGGNKSSQKDDIIAAQQLAQTLED